MREGCVRVYAWLVGPWIAIAAVLAVAADAPVSAPTLPAVPGAPASQSQTTPSVPPPSPGQPAQAGQPVSATPPPGTLPAPASFPIPFPPVPTELDADGPISEVVIEAPEPRYVAPTRRDRIGRIWAPVYINERGPFRLVLDTGSSHAAVNASVAAALGIDLTSTRNRVILRGVTGSRIVPTISVDSVIIGDLQLRPATLPIVIDALGGADGVLGTDGLQDKRIFIDFRRDRITIFRSRGERAPPGYLTIPVKVVNGLLVANVRVGRMRASAIIDTGGQGSLANEAFRIAVARRIKPEDIRADEITGATLDVQRGDRMIIPPIMLGDVQINQAHITTGDLHIFQHWHMTKDPVVLIGMDVLGQFDTLIIDYRRKELQVLMRRGS